MAVVLRLRRSHSLTNRYLLQYPRLLSSGDSKQASLNSELVSDEQIEKKWKQITASLLSLRDRYTVDGRLLSEMINSRQAFLNDTINRLSVLSALPSYPTVLPPQTLTTINLRYKLINLESLDRLINLKDMLVKEDELSAELTDSKLTCLQEIIMNSMPPRNKLNDERRSELNVELLRLRMKEVQLYTFAFLPRMLIFLRETIFRLNIVARIQEMMLVKKDEMLAELTNSTLTCLEIEEIFNNFFNHWNSVPPKDWKLNEMWNELRERQTRIMRLREMEVESNKDDSTSKKILCGRRKTKMLVVKKDDKLTLYRQRTFFVEILGEELKTLNNHLRLKEMLMKEDELSAELANSRLTSLQEILHNFFEIRPQTSVLPLLVEGQRKKWNELNERWNELNEGLMRLIVMEVEDVQLLQSRLRLRLFHS